MGTIHVINHVKIHLYSRDHNPPHIHATYAEYEVVIEIETGEPIKGELPKTQMKEVQIWLSSEENKKLLLEMFQELNPTLRG